MKRPGGKLTYANVISTIALFLVLAGGSAYAAHTMLPRNSVGTKQLKPRSVTATKLSGSAMAALRGLPGPQGPAGPAGARGATGPEGTVAPPIIDASAVRQPLSSGTYPLHLEGQTFSSGSNSSGAFLLTELVVKAATASGEPSEVCAAHIRIYDNGEYLTSLSAGVGSGSGSPGNPAILTLYRGRAAPFALGLTDPGASHVITAEYLGTENDCAHGAELVGLRIVAQPLG